MSSALWITLIVPPICHTNVGHILNFYHFAAIERGKPPWLRNAITTEKTSNYTIFIHIELAEMAVVDQKQWWKYNRWNLNMLQAKRRVNTSETPKCVGRERAGGGQVLWRGRARAVGPFQRKCAPHGLYTCKTLALSSLFLHSRPKVAVC